MKLNRAQKQMVEDGFPAGLFRTQAQRAAWWDKNPPKSLPMFELTKTRNEDAATAAFRASLDERKRLKSLAGIARMKTRFVAKAIDHSKMRWDPRKAKFVEDTGSKPVIGFAPAITTLARSGTTPRKREATPAGANILTKDNAEAVAKLNGVWKDSYEKLRDTGRIVMTVGNVLKGLVRKGGEVKWQ